MSVVVPTYNRAETLVGCIAALHDQDYPADLYEVIIADDGSSDATGSAVARLAAARSLPRTAHLWGAHRGSNRARNRGVAAAHGDIICFVDDDIRPEPRWLAEMARGFSARPDAGCLGGPVHLLVEGSLPRICGKEALGESELDLGDEPIEAEHVWGANMALRRDDFDAVGPFREDLVQGGEEVEWQDRLRLRGGRVVYWPSAAVWHLRTHRQLSVPRLMASRFIRGRGQGLNAPKVGRSYPRRDLIKWFGASLAHGLQERCAVGFIDAAQQVGRMAGLTEAGIRGVPGIDHDG